MAGKRYRYGATDAIDTIRTENSRWLARLANGAFSQALPTTTLDLIKHGGSLLLDAGFVAFGVGVRDFSRRGCSADGERLILFDWQAI